MASRQQRQNASSRPSNIGRQNSRMPTQSTLRQGSIRSSRRNGLRSSRRGGAEDRSLAQARIFMDGRDVTPKSLLSTSSRRNQQGPSDQNPLTASALRSRSTTPTSSQSDFYNDNIMTPSVTSEVSNVDSLNENDFGIGGHHSHEVKHTSASVQHDQDLPQQFTADQLNEQVSIELCETETMTLFHIPSRCVWANDQDEVARVTKANQRYKELVSRREDSDLLVHRNAQTFNNPTKTKDVQATPPATADSGCQVAKWNIYDAYKDDQDVLLQSQLPSAAENLSSSSSGDGKKAGGVSRSVGVGAQTSSMLSSQGAGLTSRSHLASSARSLATQSTSSLDSDHDEFDADGLDGDSLGRRKVSELERLTQTSEFKEALRSVERAVLQNVMHPEHLAYRDAAWQHKKDDQQPGERDGYDDGSEDDESDLESETSSSTSQPGEEERPSLTRLWSFKCPQTAGRNVSSMDWNRRNLDLLATGYGDTTFGSTKPGMICFWTLKNPTFPERIIHTVAGVCSLDWCEDHPFLLAVGLYNGDVTVYDVRDDTDKPTLQSQYGNKHSEAVWGVRWGHSSKGHSGGGGGSAAGQKLTSISTDGKVKQWSMKKGFDAQDIMVLKRKANLSAQFGSQSNQERIINRLTSGLTVDFPLGDDSQYLVGTEDGIIHKCSVSYNEQVLESYYGHTGPVYKVRCSPLIPSVFLSCSADWTRALWRQDEPRPLVHFKSGFDYVQDITWSPHDACVFAACTRDGRVEVWDMETSTLDPFIQYKVPEDDKQLSAVLFSRNAPALLVGSSDGSVDVFKVFGLRDEQQSPAEAGHRLNKALEKEGENRPPVGQASNAI